MRLGMTTCVVAVMCLGGCMTVDIEASKQRATQVGMDQCAADGKLWQGKSIEVRGRDVVASGGCYDVDNRATLEAEAARIPNGETLEYPDYTLIESTDRLSQYYFTKLGHPIYPWSFAFHLERGNPHAPPHLASWGWAIPSNTRVPPDSKAAAAVYKWRDNFLCEAINRCLSSPPK